MAASKIRKHCQLAPDAESLLKTAMEELGLSAGWRGRSALRKPPVAAWSLSRGSEEISPSREENGALVRDFVIATLVGTCRDAVFSRASQHVGRRSGASAQRSAPATPTPSRRGNHMPVIPHDQPLEFVFDASGFE